MRKKILKVSSIFIDDEIYPRDDYSKITVTEYAKAMKFGDTFPPIRIAIFKKKNYLVDGLHRLKANEELGEEFINADVQENLTTKLDIYLASIRANLKHGRTLSSKDKLKVAKQLKKMKVEIDDISKLLHISDKDLIKIELSSRADIQKLVVTSDSFKSVISEKKTVVTQDKYVGSTDTEYRADIMSPEDEQFAELNAFWSYLKFTDFVKNKRNKKRLMEIEKLIKKELILLRKA